MNWAPVIGMLGFFLIGAAGVQGFVNINIEDDKRVSARLVWGLFAAGAVLISLSAGITP